MSKKNKMFRAWVHNYPEGGERSAFEFGWRNGKKERARLEADNKSLREENAELEAELEDTVTACLAAKSSEDIMRKQLSELRGKNDATR